MSTPSQEWTPNVGDRIATNGNGKEWTVRELVTIVPGVIDVLLHDPARNLYLRRALGHIRNHFHPAPRQSGSEK